MSLFNPYQSIGKTVALLVAALLLEPLVSTAIDTEEWPIKPHPHLGAALSYDDNVGISSSKEQGDFFAIVSPGIELDYGSRERNYLALDYTLSLERYHRLTSQDANNHLATLGGHLALTHTKFDLFHEFREATSVNVEAGARVKELSNLTRFAVEYEVSPRTAVGLNYRQEFHDFMTGGLIDYNQFEVGASFFYHMFPKTDLFGQINYGWVERSQQGDQNYEQVNLGLRGRFTDKITGTAKVGFEHREFQGSIADTDTPTASVTVEAAFSPRTSAALIVSRTINPSITSAGNSYIASRVELNLRQNLWTEKVALTAGGAYERDEYDQRIAGKERDDNVWEGRAGINYDVTKWLAISLLYHHRQDDSSLSASSFSQNVTTLAGLLHF